MSYNLYNIPEIEDILFNEILESGIVPKEHVFAGNRPRAINPKMDKFIVVRASTNSNYNGAIGNLYMSIEIYARNINGFRNTNELTKLFESITSLLPFNNPNYSFMFSTTTPSYSDGNDFHYSIINCLTIINK